MCWTSNDTWMELFRLIRLLAKGAADKSENIGTGNAR
jgi:hypothetical protein